METCYKCSSKNTKTFQDVETTISGYKFELSYMKCDDCNNEFIPSSLIRLNDESLKLAKHEQMPTIYIDMDDVLCQYTKKHNEMRFDGMKYPQCQYGFFTSLEMMNGAKSAMEMFQKKVEQSKYDVYILTAPSIENPMCYTEKRVWVEENLGKFWLDRLIISPNKGLLKGEVLIDDYASGRHQEDFEGRLIQFGTKEFPNWERIARYFL